MTTVKNYHQPKKFAYLVCPVERVERAHSAGKVMSASGMRGVRLECICMICGCKHEVLTNLPPGYKLYEVKIIGEDNSSIPLSLRPLEALQETLTVPGESRQDAKDRAEFAHSLRFKGHIVKYYVDGTIHLDERF